MNQLGIIQQQNDEMLVLSLAGQVDAITAEELVAIADTIKMSPIIRYVVVDLEKVTLIDSSGIGVLVSILKHTRSEGGDTVIANLSAQPEAVFKILNLDKAIQIFESVEEAIGNRNAV